MNLKLIIDENVDFHIVSFLKEKNIPLQLIGKEYPGIQDEEILKMAKQEEAVIVTEDKDFGEWIFAHGYQIGIILLRYTFTEREAIKQSLLKVIEKHGLSLLKKFTVITSRKIRFRTF